MLRNTSPVETVLTYATFFVISLALHLVVIVGTRSQADASRSTEESRVVQRIEGGAGR